MLMKGDFLPIRSKTGPVLETSYDYIKSLILFLVLILAPLAKASSLLGEISIDANTCWVELKFTELASGDSICGGVPTVEHIIYLILIRFVFTKGRYYY